MNVLDHLVFVSHVRDGDGVGATHAHTLNRVAAFLVGYAVVASS